MSEVIIYSVPTCLDCRLAKKYFEKHNVTYKEIDISTDKEAAREMMDKSGQMNTPVIIIKKDGKEEILLGLKKARIDELLGIQ
jgi:glutaredoxin 3